MVLCGFGFRNVALFRSTSTRRPLSQRLAIEYVTGSARVHPSLTAHR